jgi:hypothetical protein
MEVHAHTHTARKKWTHYFWEFLMLFLAVFCGFLAEYQLEHKIEKDREKQYMEGMLEDLSSDTAALNRTIMRATAMQKGLDSLKDYLYDVENIVTNTSIIYQQNATYTRHILLSLSDQTATQLRNSGGMRLIRKRNVANTISAYWRNSNNAENTAKNFNDAIIEKSNAENIIFNRKYCNRLSTDPSTGLDTYFTSTDTRLMTNDQTLLISYANTTDRLQEFIDRFIISQLSNLKLKAIDLIDLIKKEYHL